MFEGPFSEMAAARTTSRVIRPLSRPRFLFYMPAMQLRGCADLGSLLVGIDGSVLISGGDLVKEMAETKKATPAQIALTWVLAQRPWIVPIPGTRKVERLMENLGAADVDLTAGELSDLNTALADIKISGDRYPEGYAERAGR
jgi:diketogulonate reductase-like aldo/keto reductase